MYFEEEVYQNLVDHTELDTLLDRLESATDITIVHDKDPDGFCSAALMNLFLDHMGILPTLTQVRRLPVSHGRPFQESDLFEKTGKCDVLIILDHACNRAKLYDLSKIANHVLVIDHHPESLDGLDASEGFYIGTDGDVSRIISTKFSSTALTDLLLRAYYPLVDIYSEELTSIVNHYDMWCFGVDEHFDKRVKAFAAAFFHYGHASIEWDKIVRDGDGYTYLTKTIEAGMALLDFKNRQIDTILKNRVIKTNFMFEGLPYCVAIAYHTDSYDELGSRMVKEIDGVDFAMIVSLIEGDNRNHRLYLRSDDEHEDCSVFARYLGGGGHRNSCGTVVSTRTYVTFFNLL